MTRVLCYFSLGHGSICKRALYQSQLIDTIISFAHSSEAQSTLRLPPIESVEMNKLNTCDAATSEGQAADIAPCHFGEKFRQLAWRDKLNVIFAAVLGVVLVLALSPILLVAWVCLLLGKARTP